MSEKNFFSAYSESLPFHKNPLFKTQLWLELQRNNLEAIKTVQKLLIKNIGTITERQVKLASQWLSDHSNMAQGLTGEGTPEEKISKNISHAQEAFDRLADNLKELTDKLNEASDEATELVNKRIKETMRTVQESAQQAQKNAA